MKLRSACAVSVQQTALPPTYRTQKTDAAAYKLFRRDIQQELSYRQQIARQRRTQYAEGIYRQKCYTVTLKSRLRVSRPRLPRGDLVW